MYKIGDYVVYRKNVCIIKNIKKNVSSGDLIYVMNPIDDESLTINIPVKNEINLLRNIISKEEAISIINNIYNIDTLENIDDRLLENKYKELLNLGSHEDLVKIIKTTYLRNEYRLKNNKKVNERDNKYFNLAEKYLYNELSVALNMSIEQIKEYIIKNK